MTGTTVTSPRRLRRWAPMLGLLVAAGLAPGSVASSHAAGPRPSPLVHVRSAGVHGGHVCDEVGGHLE